MAIETETITSLPVTTTLQAKPTATTIPAAKADSEVKVLTTADYKAAGACLASCFADDPVVTYPFDAPDAAHWTAEQRESVYVRTFECAAYAHILRGIALGVPSSERPGEFDAVALWMPPGRNMDDFVTLLRSGLWRLQWSYTAQGKARFYDEFLPLLNRTKAEVLGQRDDHSWYLVYLGTREEARGRGLARKLIRAGTDQADDQRRPTYLESSHRANVAFYERLGFRVVKTIALKEGDKPEMDVMVREAGAAKV